MARFSFVVSNRKKPAPITNSPPASISKAHRILGSTLPNIEPARLTTLGSDHASGPDDTDLETTEYADLSYDASSCWTQSATSHCPSQPSSLKSGGDGEPMFNHASSAIGVDMEQLSQFTTNSSADCNSWYDKSKMPLSISQQTSASAMAKGLPLKAQRLLDIDSQAVNAGIRRRPSRLDFANLRGSRKGTSNFASTKTSSDLANRPRSPPAPTSSVLNDTPAPRKLRKRSTGESLQSAMSTEAPHDSRRRTPKPTHAESVPNLYQHYEQMSFRQVMASGSEHDSTPNFRKTPMSRASEWSLGRGDSAVTEPTLHLSTLSSDLESDRSSRPVALGEVSHQASRVFPSSEQLPLIQNTMAFTAPITLRPDVYHGRQRLNSFTSRRSRDSKTVRAQQLRDVDFQDKSVLMLSSDSEGDSDDDNLTTPPCHTRPGLHPQQHGRLLRHLMSDSNLHMIPERSSSVIESPTFETDPSKAKSADKAEANSSQPSQSLPNRLHETPSTSTFSTLPIPSQSPELISAWSPSSTPGFDDTSPSWPEDMSGSEVRQSQAGTLPPTQAPSAKLLSPVSASSSRSTLESGTHHSHHVRKPSVGASIRSEMLTASQYQPTPPRSPTSPRAGCQSQSPRQPHLMPDATFEGQNRLMSVTPQEEMLLAALRQKRQELLRTSQVEGAVKQFQVSLESGLPAEEHQDDVKRKGGSPVGAAFDFDFPTPPNSNSSVGRGHSHSQHIPPDLSFGTLADDQSNGSGTSTADLWPHPRESRLSPELMHHGITPSLQTPETEVHASPKRSLEWLPTLGLETNDFDFGLAVEVEPTLAGKSSLETDFPLLTSQRYEPETSQTAGQADECARGHRGGSDAGVPRPDSPLENFPTVPATRHIMDKKAARVSAFGPPQSSVSQSMI